MCKKVFVLSILSVFLLILFTAGLSSCKQYTANLDDFLSYWSSQAAVARAEIKTAHTADKDGYASLASDKDAEIILTVRNPKQYQFLLPTASERRSAFSFQSGVKSTADSGDPKPDTDYTLSQLDGSTLKLVYKKEFLQAHEHGAYNLNPEIVLWSKEGRKFNESFTFNIRANTPPPAVADAVVGQTGGSEPYYVLCLQLPEQAMEASCGAGGGGELLHGDITALLINGRTYGVSVDGSGIKKPAEADFITRNEVAPLTVPGAEEIPGGKWVVFYKTDVPVADGTPVKQYTVQTADRMGLKSREYPASTKPNKPAAVQVRAVLGSTSGGDLSAANDADSAHELIVSGGGDALLQLSCGRPEQAVVHCTVKALADGDTKTYTGNPISIPLSAESGSKMYQLTFFADAEGFTPLAPKTVYYRVKRLTEPELIALSAENAVHGTYPFNQAFAGAVKDYTVTVPYGGSAAQVTLKAAAAAGCELREIDIDGTGTLLDPAVQAKSETVTLSADETDSRRIKITVRLASDHTKTAVYTVQVRYGPTLSGLTVQHGTPPAPLAFRDSGDTTDVPFSAGRLEYYVFVPEILPATVAISATAAAGAQTASLTAVRAAGTAVPVTGNSVPLPIAGGRITVTVPVTKDGQETRYTVHIKRKAYEFTVKGEPAGLGTVHITEGGGVSVLSGNGGAECRVRAEVGALVSLEARAAAEACFKKWSTGLTHNPLRFSVNTSGNDISAYFISTVIDTTIAAEKRWKHLKEAVAAIPDGGTITINGEVKATGDTGNNGEIVINKNLTIKGKTGSSTDILNANKEEGGKPKHRIFKVEGKKNLTLKNGKNNKDDLGNNNQPNGKGGAVYSEGDLEINNILITDCEALIAGGGIYCTMRGAQSGDPLSFVMKNSEVSDCKTSTSHYVSVGGGVSIAVQNSRMKVEMTDVTIKNCEAKSSGAGLSLWAPGTSTEPGGIVFTRVRLEQNKIITGMLNHNGGAGMSCAIPEGMTLTLKNCTVIHNETPRNGGGLYIYKSDTLIKNGEVKSNEAMGEGGGVYVKGAEGTEKPGLLALAGTARVTRSTGAEQNVKGKNEIYLGRGTKIVIRGALNPQDGTAGRITPQNYTENTPVLEAETGVDLEVQADMFDVTPETSSEVPPPPAQKWTIDSQGKLQKTVYTRVPYTELGSYFPSASTTEVNYIKITGVTEDKLRTSPGNRSPLGQLLNQYSAKKFAVELPKKIEGLTSMRNCFYVCTNLTQAPTIPESVTDMGNCFADCIGLTQVPTIPASVTNMAYCFAGCTGLTQVPTIPESVTDMSSCFSDCKALTQAPVIPESVTTMERCFERCTMLERVKLECNYNSDAGGAKPFQAVFHHCIALQPGGIKVKAEYYANYTRATALTDMDVPGSSEDEQKAKFSTFD